jgi:C-terminus of histone H2A
MLQRKQKECYILRHSQLAVRNDEGLKKLMTHTTIAAGGVLSTFAVLLPKKRAVKAACKYTFCVHNICKLMTRVCMYKGMDSMQSTC